MEAQLYLTPYIIHTLTIMSECMAGGIIKHRYYRPVKAILQTQIAGIYSYALGSHKRHQDSLKNMA